MVKKVFLLIFCIYLLGFFAHALYLGKTVYGDGVYYYQWLHLIPSKFAIGPAILWYPVYSLFPNEFAVGLVSVLYAIVGLILLYRLTTILTVLAIAFATNLFFYGSLDTVNSHALSFFAATVFLSFALAKKKNYFLIGTTLGLLALIRPQDAVFGVLALHPGVIPGFLLAFSPQLLAWQTTTGKFWLSPYFINGEGFNLLHLHIPEVLGMLFLYAPILFLGLYRLHRLFYFVLFLELIIISSWSTWWQGASYGSRMFVSSLPFFAFGIANSFNFLKKHGWDDKMILFIIIGPLSALNMLLIFFFLLTH